MTARDDVRPIHELTLGDVSRSNARRFATRLALVEADRALSFAALDHAAAGLAGALRARGVGTGDLVAWLGPNSDGTVVSLLAVSRLGAAIAPLHVRLADVETREALADLAPAVAISSTVGKARLGDLAPGLELVEPTARGPAVVDDDRSVSERDVALVLLTAAFAGRPRAAQLTHRNLLTQALLLAARDHLGPADTYLASGPLAHIGALQYVLAHWLVGARVIVVPSLEAREIVRIIAREHVTGAFLVPASIPALVEAAEDGDHDLSSLRTPALAGDPLLERWTAMTSRPSGVGAIGTSTGYGQTELTGLATATAIGAAAPVGNVGWPQHAAVIRVVEPGGLRELPVGCEGEIVVRGPLVMAGYRDDSDAGTQGGWHRTGDIGRLERDGSITFVGPVGLVVKTGGENVYPLDVEAVLRHHPSVGEACVVGLPDERWGHVVAAAVSPSDGVSIDIAALDAWCRARLATFKRPRRWKVVTEWPRTATGDPDRDAVADLFPADDMIADRGSRS